MSYKGKITERPRYLKPKYLLIRQAHSKNKIRLGYVQSEYNHSDLGTKANHTIEKFERHTKAVLDGDPILRPKHWY